MDLLIIPILFFSLWKLELQKTGFHEDYLSVENSTAVKGILSMLVIAHHLSQGVESGYLLPLFRNVGVLCVSVFFFYSGYGLQKSYARKPGYRSSILRRRIPSVLAPYLIATVIYWVLHAWEGVRYSPVEVWNAAMEGRPIVSFSWYIHSILLFYAVYYLSTWLFPKKPWGILLCSILAVCLWVPFCRSRYYGQHWYVSAIAFPMGIFWANQEKNLLPRLQKHYFPALAASFAAFGLCFGVALMTTNGMDVNVPLYWLGSCAFVLFLLLVLMKVTFKNRALLFLGGISFEIYIIHGFFITLYRGSHIYLEHPLVWSLAVVASTIPAAWGLSKLFRLLKK